MASHSKFAGRGKRKATPRPTAGRPVSTPPLSIAETCDALREGLNRPRPYVAPPLARRALDILAELSSIEHGRAVVDAVRQLRAALASGDAHQVAGAQAQLAVVLHSVPAATGIMIALE